MIIPAAVKDTCPYKIDIGAIFNMKARAALARPVA